MTDARITLRFDGGSRGNPGPAAVGIVLETDDGTAVRALGRFIGNATNNVAEYKALIMGLEEAQKIGVKKLRVLGDSELVIKQLLGVYRVKNEALQPLWARAKELLRAFDQPEVGHNRRGHNSLADALANIAMDKRREVTDDDLPGSGIVDSGSAAEEETEAAGGSTGFECVRCGCLIRVERAGKGEKPFTCRCGAPMRGV